MATSCRSENSAWSFLSVTVSENTDLGFLSIGEVLGILLEEFPDITISKIRFLESQGLIDPERTASGYRKFYEADVELLKVILREQRENYLPLRVIKDRIDSGEIDPSGEIRKELIPTPIHLVPGDPLPSRHTGASKPETLGTETSGIDEPVPSFGPRSAARNQPGRGEHKSDSQRNGENHSVPEVETFDADHTPVTPHLLPGVVLSREELCSMTGLTLAQCDVLEQFGLLSGRGSGSARIFGEDAVEIGRLAAKFMAAGVDARHLRGWMTAADREASLYEQLITPRMRQRNPQARAEALEQLKVLDELGARMRTAMMRKALRHHFET
jgi:DNA-binding transcriptional MerR regulator